MPIIFLFVRLQHFSLFFWFSFCFFFFLLIMVDHLSAPISHRHRRRFHYKDFFKICGSIIIRWCQSKRSSSPSPNKTKSEASTFKESPKGIRFDTEGEEDEDMMNGGSGTAACRNKAPNDIDVAGSQSPLSAGMRSSKHRSMDGSCYPKIASPSLRSGRRRSPLSPSSAPTTGHSFLPNSRSRRSMDGVPSYLSRSSSRTPIMFSNSSTGSMMKPPAMVKTLECTLEELCYGYMKKFKITRDVITAAGYTIEEEEMVTIQVKPGWKEGTKITFDGMGDEKSGVFAADVTFVIAEKEHPLFRREGDDLEVGVEIPLVQALTGCQISVPLLGGEETTLVINNDIIYPGYQKIITGQGMPNTKHQEKRGDLKVFFLIDFPTELTPRQRSDIVDILQDSSC